DDDPGALKTRSGVMMGTTVYMSPEQCRGAGEVDPRSDIYSMGCVLMAMLTGEPPFDGAGTGDLIVAHMQTRPPLAVSPVPGMPAVVDEILQRCLAKAPDHRPASRTELADQLAAAERVVEATAASAAAADSEDSLRIPVAVPEVRSRFTSGPTVDYLPT